MNTNLSDDIITALIALIDQAQAGFAFDPEVDFSSMRATTDKSQADTTLYAKTGKYISVQRVHKPSRLVVFLDINCNMRIAFQKRGLEALIFQIINTIGAETLVELRDANNQNISSQWQHIVAAYTKKTYESGFARVAEYARKESQQGNVVLIVSDFLDARVVDFDTFTPYVAFLRITLPVVSSYFHNFYLEPLVKPESPYWFEL